MTIVYIGRGSDFGVRTVFHFLATNGQTSVSGSDADGHLSFGIGNYIDVYLNGVRLKSVRTIILQLQT